MAEFDAKKMDDAANDASLEIEKLKDMAKDCDVAIDALLGIGAKGELREPVKSLVNFINSLKIFKISVDVPTPGVKADLTISFHIKKTENAKIVPIGIPKEAETFVGPGDVLYTLPKRRGDEHKGDFGRILVIAGSRDYIGAPMLVAKAAFRTGVDLVTIACPRYVAERMPYDANMIVRSLNSENFLSAQDIEEIKKINFDVAVIGNGLGTENETKLAVKKFLRENEKPIVVDADALKLIEPRNLKENMILTPHAGEFKLLFSDYKENFDERVSMVKNFAKKYDTTIVLKGQTDIISNKEKTKLNRTGNPGMTVGGTGDVLAGIIGALATKADNFHAAASGTFLNGLAGDLAKEEFGYHFTATDVIEKIPNAIRFCEKFF